MLRCCAAALGACCLVVLVGMVAENRHRQVAHAAARAQDKVASLERALDAERAKAAAALAARPPCARPASSLQVNGMTPLAPLAVHAEVRAAVRAAADGSDGDGDTSAATSSEREAARAALREALAAEVPGWCGCPPLPNITLLCQAAVHAGGGCVRAAASARAEADALRQAVLEANARAQQASDAAVEALAMAAAHQRRRVSSP